MPIAKLINEIKINKNTQKYKRNLFIFNLI